VNPLQLVAREGTMDVGYKPYGASVNVALSAVSAAIAAANGVRYLVSTDTQCWINWNGAAVAGQGICLNPGFAQIMMFAELSDAAVAPQAIAAGAGKLTLQPIKALADPL